eukprot:TRINITY_DN35983_c0_g1_i1.p1 TRINITY_DN35983_c0_g1~~TRINITY_DN35983_c0_g1_i1.p1  ORF type:complete len:567 (+),score=145.52 TRINITY_DN35983_c0_g1_i1:76-1776(+)
MSVVQGGRPKGSSATPGPFKKGEDTDRDALVRENAELKNHLYEVRQENKKLRTQLYQVSVALDQARSEGFAAPYDIQRGLDLLKEIDERATEDDRRTLPPSAVAGAATTARGDEANEPHEGEQRAKHRRRFEKRFEFPDHQGSVFCARFSPDGALIASGSFEGAVRVFNIKETQQRHRFDSHSLIVSDLSWSPDSAALATCSFDTSCRIWDVQQGRVLTEYYMAQKFLLSVTFSKAEPTSVFASGSDGSVYWLDRRVGRPQTRITHRCMVNSLHVLPGGQQLLAGDKEGSVNIWDLRLLRARLEAVAPDTPGAPVVPVPPPADDAPAPPSTTKFKTVDQELDEQATQKCIVTSYTVRSSGERPGEMTGTAIRDDIQEVTRRQAITHAHTPVIGPEELVGRYIAMSSYDNVLRLYDRGSFATSGGEVLAPDERDTRSPALVTRLIDPGMIFSGFPIKGCFYCGENSLHSVPGEEARDDTAAQPRGLKESVLLATGSAASPGGSADAFVYDITDSVRRGGAAGGATLLQRLQGHKDTVYGVHAHPKLPWLLTYSADNSVKVWSPAKLH